MTRWSLRARIAVAVTLTVLVAFLAGASLLVWLSSVDTQRSTSSALVRRLEQRGLVAEVERRQVPTGTLQALARRRLLLSALLAAAVAGPLGWVLVGKALDPLRRLRESAAGVAETSELARRLPSGEGPEEVDSLARTLNSMLERLQAADASLREALDSSRGFAAGAAHELRTPLTSLQADLDSLGSPALGDEERAQVLAEMQAEHERLVVLLDQLLALSRGDLGTDSQWEVVDLGDLVELSVGAAARRWPAARLDVSVQGEQAVDGSPEGLRLLVDNLVANAVIHGGGAVSGLGRRLPGAAPDGGGHRRRRRPRHPARGSTAGPGALRAGPRPPRPRGAVSAWLWSTSRCGATAVRCT